MYGSILNQVEPSVNLYSQTTQPSSYYGIWTTTLGVNQVTFVRNLNASTISGYNSNVMIIKQLDNKNKYKTKLIRTMQIDENSNIYFSGCTINNGQANQIYYGTGYSWVLVNNEYTPPSGGSGGLSYNLFAQATEPDTYDGIWTTKLDVDTVKFTDLEVIEVGEMRENDVNISATTYMSEQQFVIDGDLLYIISGAYTTSSSLISSGLGTNFITVYNMSTKKFVKKITIPYNNGMYGHSCVLYNNIIYIVGGIVGTTSMISDRIVMYNITNDEFSQSSVLPKLCYNKTFIYNNIIYIVGGYVGNISTLSTSVYKYNILNDTYTSVPSPYTILDSGGVQVGSTAYIICGSQNGVRSNAVLRYELLTDTWSVQKYVDFKSTIRYGYYYKDGYLYATAADPDYYSYSAPASVLKTDFVDYNYENVYYNDIIRRSKRAAVVNLNNKIYIIGGKYNSTTYYNSVVIYDIDTNTHTTGAVCPSYSGYQSAYCLYDNRYIYIFGGENTSGKINASYRYDTTNNSWSTRSSLPQYLSSFSACCVGDYIYIFGGIGGAATSSETYQTVTYAYNIANNTYSTCASIPTALAYYMVSTGKNDFEILLYGGTTGSSTYSRKVYSYNIRANSYSSIFNLPTDEANSGVVRVGNSVYLLGVNNAYCYSVFQTAAGLAGYNLNKSLSDSSGTRCIYYNGYIYVLGFDSVEFRERIRRLRVSKYLNSIPDVTPSASLIGYNDELYMNICSRNYQSPQTTCVSNIYKIETESYLGSYSAYFNISVGKCYSNAHINDNKLYLYGNSSGGINITDIYIYDLKTQSMPMVTSPNLGAPIDACSFLHNDKIYIVGGILYNNTLNSNFVIYDIKTMVKDISLDTKITYTNELKRFAHFAFMYNNMIYCCGGYTLADKSSVTPFLVRINMSGDGVITTLTQCPKALIYAQAILIDTKAYVVLGYDPTLVAFNSDILVYDILTDTWSTDLTSTLKLIHHRVLLRGTDIFIFGGEDDLGNLSDKVYKYDTLTKELSEYIKLPFGIAKFGLAYWEDEDKAIISGGMVGDPQSESSDIYYCTFKTLDNPSTEIVVHQLDDKHNHSTKLITDNNMKVSFTDVFINSEEPYDVYKGDGTQWIKIK